MSLITHHWSASPPARIYDYHLEYALTGAIVPALREKLLAAQSPKDVDFVELCAQFHWWKNVDFATATDYGTWHWNHDFRDGSPNIEIGALCMGGEGVSVAGSWGTWPFTIAHAWMAVAIGARVAKLKGIDPLGSFPASGGFQNGPLYNISTHGERALQTIDPAASLRPGFGYFAYSGDGDCRWDLSALDYSRSASLATPDGARAQAISSAAWIRKQTAATIAAGITDFWGLDR